MAESRRHDRAAAQLARQRWQRGLSGRIVGSGRLCPSGGATAAQFGMCTLPAVANLTPPSAVHVPWHVHVHAGVAVPGTLLNLQHSPAPSRVRNPHAMRVGVVVGRARGPDGFCLGMAVHPCCHCALLSFASNKDVGL